MITPTQPMTSLTSVSKIQSFSMENAQFVRHTYFDNVAITAEKEYQFFTQGVPKGAVSNWGKDAGKLPNNISFVVKQIAVKFNLKGTAQAGLTEVIEKLMPRSILELKIGEQPFGEFTLGEFAPAILASFDSGASNILENMGDYNAQAVIDLPDGFLIPIESNATVEANLKFADTPTAAVGAELHFEFKGFKLTRTV